MRSILYALLMCSFCLLISCKYSKQNAAQSVDINNDAAVKEQLYHLEHNWLQYEFAADTASIVPLMDENFIVISPGEVTDKKTELDGVYQTVMKMKADSIFIDSFKIEEPFIVKEFDHTAVVTFICHSYKTNKGNHSQRRTRFYDVWRQVNGEWKGVSSQVTTVEEIK